MLLNVKQVAEKLRITEGKVKFLIENHKLRSQPIKSGVKKKFYRVDERDLRDLKKSGELDRIMRTTRFKDLLKVNGSKSTGSGVPAGYITFKEASEMTGLKESSLHGRVKHGLLKKIKVEGRPYVNSEQLKEGRLRGGRVKKTSEEVRESNGDDQLLAGISGIFSRISAVEASQEDLNNRLEGISKAVETVTSRLESLITALGGQG